MNKKMILLIFIFSLNIIASKTITKKALNEIKVSSIKKDGFHVLLIKKNNKITDKLKLDRFAISPELKTLQKIEKNKNLYIVDYFKGYNGTKVVKACSDVYLIEALPSGKFKVHQKKEYRCQVSSSGNEEEIESFYYAYHFDKKKNKLIFGTP